ncbi:MAG: hypothetical protein QF805_27805, partial [Pirellulaceae bacterium]|nr:hypothetical protein [Pirellulaceae bacterium]
WRSLFQFRLSALLLVVTVACCLMGGWYYWEITRPNREMARDIEAATYFSPEQKRLMINLVWRRDAAAASFKKHLGIDPNEPLPAGQTAIRTIQWSGEHTDDRDRKLRVFLFGHFSAFDSVVVTDEDYQLLSWTESFTSGVIREAQLRGRGDTADIMVELNHGGYVPRDDAPMHRYKVVGTTVSHLPIELNLRRAGRLQMDIEAARSAD